MTLQKYMEDLFAEMHHYCGSGMYSEADKLLCRDIDLEMKDLGVEGDTLIVKVGLLRASRPVSDKLTYWTELRDGLIEKHGTQHELFRGLTNRR